MPYRLAMSPVTTSRIQSSIKQNDRLRAFLFNTQIVWCDSTRPRKMLLHFSRSLFCEFLQCPLAHGIAFNTQIVWCDSTRPRKMLLHFSRSLFCEFPQCFLRLPIIPNTDSKSKYFYSSFTNPSSVFTNPILRMYFSCPDDLPEKTIFLIPS